MRRTADKIKVIAFILCAVWLSTTVAFFAMITSAGMEEMELEIGPLLSLQGSSARFFALGIIGFGLVMTALFIWRRRLGFVLTLIWSLWWGIVLSSVLFTSVAWSERAIIFVVVLFFAGSAWVALSRLQKNIQLNTDKP